VVQIILITMKRSNTFTVGNSTRLQRKILQELSKQPLAVKQLAEKLGKRIEDVSRQLGSLSRLDLVNYVNEYDPHYGRRVHKYNITTLGRITFLLIGNFSMDSSAISKFIKTENGLIRDYLLNGIKLIETDDSEIEKTDEPLRYCELENSFHDQPLLASLEKMKIPVKETVAMKTSNQRLSSILDKKCDLAILPVLSLDEISKNKDAVNDIMVIGALTDNFVRPKFFSGDFSDEDVFYYGGYSRKKFARDQDKNPVEVKGNELLKGIHDGDFKSFVANDPDALLLEIEFNYMPKSSFMHHSFVVSNSDAFTKNAYLKKIYRNHETLLSVVRNPDVLTKHVGEYAKNELLPYIKQKEKIFPKLNSKINSELLGQVLA